MPRHFSRTVHSVVTVHAMCGQSLWHVRQRADVSLAGRAARPSRCRSCQSRFQRLQVRTGHMAVVSVSCRRVLF